VDAVETAELNLEFASNDEEKSKLHDAKASKTWRALRLASKTKLSLFDKVDDGRDLKCFIEEAPHGSSNIEGGEMTAEGGGQEA
jgi:THO complex subunit 1